MHGVGITCAAWERQWLATCKISRIPCHYNSDLHTQGRQWLADLQTDQPSVAGHTYAYWDVSAVVTGRSWLSGLQLLQRNLQHASTPLPPELRICEHVDLYEFLALLVLV
jgi:hypothetical protein